MIYQLRHPIGVLAIAVAIVVGVLLHDAAQVLVAQALGDPMPRRSGRLRAGIAKRTDIFGAVAAVLVGYGWPAPIEMDDRWRARRKKVALALAAGPATYLALTFASALLVSATDSNPVGQGYRFAILTTYTFAAMFILSLIPTPPLDGGRIMFVLAPQTLGWQKAKYQLVERNFGLIIALVVVLLPVLLNAPSIVGNLAVDVVNPIGHLVAPNAVAGLGYDGIGDVAMALNAR